MPNWVEAVKNSTKTCLLQDGKRKIHYTFADGSEMVEEYSINTHDLLIRKLKKKSMIGKESNWEFEVGQDFEVKQFTADGIKENIENPIFTRKDSKDSFQWRIRNLPYPNDTYKLSVENDQIVIRTTNKKYYKKFPIPDMDRLNLKLDASCLSHSHANNTLIVKYKKPIEILDQEKAIINELKKLTKKEDGDVEMCTTS